MMDVTARSVFSSAGMKKTAVGILLIADG